MSQMMPMAMHHFEPVKVLQTAATLNIRATYEPSVFDLEMKVAAKPSPESWFWPRY